MGAMPILLTLLRLKLSVMKLLQDLGHWGDTREGISRGSVPPSQALPALGRRGLEVWDGKGLYVPCDAAVPENKGPCRLSPGDLLLHPERAGAGEQGAVVGVGGWQGVGTWREVGVTGCGRGWRRAWGAVGDWVPVHTGCMGLSTCCSEHDALGGTGELIISVSCVATAWVATSAGPCPCWCPWAMCLPSLCLGSRWSP